MATYIQIGSTVTVGSGGASSIDFTSIPSTYTDLVLKISLRSTDANQDPKIEFNGVTTGYTRRALYATGTSVGSASASDSWIGTINRSADTANTFSNGEIYIPNYASSNYKFYSVDTVSEINLASANYLDFLANLWSNTAAITSIKLSALSGSLTFAQYSTASLYGIKKD
jgi:hypothetical protein